jgi:biopolymer transport protein ExbB
MDLIYTATANFQQGGPVMAPIIVLSLLMWGLIIERLLFLHRMGKTDTGEQDVPMDLDGHPLPPAAGTVLCAPVIRALIRNRRGDVKLDHRILDQYALRQKNRLNKSLGVVAALAAAAPLLGLFGTVTGMISTFESMMFYGAGNAKALASGISEALLTTESGLLVGIPGLFMARMIGQRARRLNNRLDETVMAARRSLR